MVHLDRAALLCLFSVSLLVTSGSSAAKQPFTPKKIPKELLEPAQPPPAPPPPAPPPPESDGWPHTIVSGYSTDCSREPGPTEVIVYKDRGFSGKCALLRPGFYPRAANFLIGGDEISSLKVGSRVRLRAFEDTAYGGTWEIYAPGTRSAGIGELHDEISSMRVEPADRSSTCNDLREGEIALYHHPNFQGDCVVLAGRGSYGNADTMGIENDSISSVRNNSKRELRGCWDTQLSGCVHLYPPHSEDPKLVGKASAWTHGPDDKISSLLMGE